MSNGSSSHGIHRAGMDGNGGRGGNVESGGGGMHGNTVDTGSVDIIGMVHMVIRAASVHELDGRGGGFISNDLKDASASPSWLLDVEDLGFLTLHNTLDLSGTGLVVDDAHMMLVTGNSDLRDLGSGLGSFVHSNHLVAGLDLLDADSLASSLSMDLVGADGGGGGGSHDANVNSLDGSGRNNAGDGGGSVSDRGTLYCHGASDKSRSGRDHCSIGRAIGSVNGSGA